MEAQSKDRNATRLTTWLLIIYLIVLLWILLLKLGARFSYMGERSFNLIPFREPLILNGKADVGEILLNVLIFVPLGLYAGILFQKWDSRKKMLFFFLVSLVVEGLQYILAIGAFDITDVITNTSGALLGWILFKVVEKAFRSRVRAQKVINLAATVGTVVMVLLLALLKLNLLPVRYQ